MGYYMYEIIKCPFCEKEHAHITYEENRVYKLNCTECHNTILHQDSSWDNALKFFEGLFIIKDIPVMNYDGVWYIGSSAKLFEEDIKKALKKAQTNA